ncbi:MAG: sialate O-acetylesterase, partial [Eubacteriales bacterium]
PDGNEVTVSINGISERTISVNGRWLVTLPPMDTAISCQMIIASQSEEIVLSNVAIGEVWIAAGQSNMDFPLKYDSDASDVAPYYENQNIRFYDCPKITYPGQEKTEDFSNSGIWRISEPQCTPDFSAVGFYFAKKLYEKYQVPIGIISCHMGGTSASTWMDEKYLADDEDLKVYIDEYQNALKTLDMDAYEKAYQEVKDLYKNPEFELVINGLFATTFYTKQHMEHAYIESVRKALADLVGPKYINRPAGLYQTMVKPIIGYTVRGTIWYQGETDDKKAALYGKLFSSVIRCWREAWQDDFPFIFVQLAPFDIWMRDTGVNYPQVREQQERVSKNVPNAHMISIMDQGMAYDIHPKQKKPVGERLALMAMGKVYGEDILCEPPEFENMLRDDSKIVIDFKNAGEGLVLKGDSISGLQVFVENQEIKKFEAFILNNRLYIYCKKFIFAKVVEVRYLWKGYTKANVFNSAGLPAKPFKVSL